VRVAVDAVGAALAELTRMVDVLQSAALDALDDREVLAMFEGLERSGGGCRRWCWAHVPRSPENPSIRCPRVSLVASWLLHTELHCAASRHPDDVDAASVGLVLDVITLVYITRGDLLTAGYCLVGCAHTVHFILPLRSALGPTN